MKKNNWLTDLNEVKFIEYSVNEIFSAFINNEDFFISKELLHFIRNFLIKSINITEESSFKDIEKMSENEVIEVYIILGKYIVNQMKDNFLKNYL